MYEAEASGKVESLTQVPPEIQRRFQELTHAIAAKTVLPWSEHCTECVAPKCYSTCDLYSPRADLKCRRFVDGIVRIDAPGTPNGCLLKIGFKRWGQLWTYANTFLFPVKDAYRLEVGDQRFGSVLLKTPLPRRLKRSAILRRYEYKRRQVAARPFSSQAPNCFVLECYNPNERTIELSLSFLPADSQAKLRYERMIALPPGFSRERIPYGDIARMVDLHKLFYISIIPNEVPDGTVLYFGLLNFVFDRTFTAPQKRPKVKCVVWDLDNTLWEGTLLESGPEQLVFKHELMQVITELDRRGILHSVASKNNPEDVEQVLKKFGLDEYVLHPQISWGPKSAAIEHIAKQLNIGKDTILFVDDSDFERAEVERKFPEVRTLPAGEALSLLTIPDCDVPVTAEGAQRRLMYKQAGVRSAAAADFGDDYFAFLRDCDIKLEIKSLTADNLERVHELTQRTNQMNFSGTLYSRERLTELAGTPELATFVLDCKDRFGSYGTVGFCVVDRKQCIVKDLMFSCRIQGKRIEHAFLTYLLRTLRSESERTCLFEYKRTPRNAAAGEVFTDFGMQPVAERNGVTTLAFAAGREIPDDGLVTVISPSAPAIAR